MSQHKFKIYRFQPYNSQESSTTHTNTTNFQRTNSSQSILQTDSYLNTISASPSHFLQTTQNFTNLAVTSFPPWRPSQRLRSLHTHFQNTILCQYICLPCAFCGKLLYPAKAKWIPF